MRLRRKKNEPDTGRSGAPQGTSERNPVDDAPMATLAEAIQRANLNMNAFSVSLGGNYTVGWDLEGPEVVEYWPPGFYRTTDEPYQVVVYHVTSRPRRSRMIATARPRSRKLLAEVAGRYLLRVIERHGLRPVGDASATIQEEMTAAYGTDGSVTRVIHYEIRCAVEPVVAWAPPPEEEYIVLEMGKGKS